jgi:hypothetical protein
MPEAQREAVIAALNEAPTPEVSSPESKSTTEAPVGDGTTPEKAVVTTPEGQGSGKVETPVVADPTKPDKKVDPAAKVEPQKAEEVDPFADPDALPADIAENPKVQALVAKSEALQTLKDVLVEGYAIATETQDGKERPLAEVVNDLRLERADAHALYDITSGKKDVSNLLGMLLNQRQQADGSWRPDPNLKYPQEVADRVFTQAANFLGTSGFLDHWMKQNGLYLVRADYKTPDGQTLPPADLSKPNPNALESRVAQLQNDAKVAADKAAADAVAASKKQVFDNFAAKVTELGNKKGVDPALLQEYVGAIANMIQGNPAIIGRIQKGNWTDVTKFFTAHHNAQLTRAQKYAQSISTSKASIQKQVPKAPGGSNAPAPDAAKKRSFANPEERRAAIVEALNEN